ncbi:MAG: 2OG-Fe(II) oxygenase [Pseudomonadota bacterium]
MAGTRGTIVVILDLQRLSETPVSDDPFEHLIVPGFLAKADVDNINADYPMLGKPGSFPVSAAPSGPGFKAVLDELRSTAFASVLETKFHVDLAGKPTMATVRDRCRRQDGKIHRDSGGKLVTVLVYLNASWNADGGRLRLLRDAENIDNYATEVPPEAGTLRAFPCTENAWHGHKPFEGQRRTIQFNWVRSRRYLIREQLRHRLSSAIKLKFA